LLDLNHINPDIGWANSVNRRAIGTKPKTPDSLNQFVVSNTVG